LPVVSVPVFHHHGVDVRGRLERARLLDHHAEPRGGREGRDHRGRVGDEQGARAGHDEHCDRALGSHGLRVGRTGLRGEEPDDQRHHQDDGNVVGGDALDQLLLPALRALRFADQLLDLADGRLALDCGDLDVDLSCEVRGSCIDRRTRLHLDRHGFTGERSLVDARGSRAHRAVGRKVLAGANAHDRAELELSERDLALLTRSFDQPRHVGSELDQLADRALRTPCGAREHQFAEPQEEREEAGGEVQLVRDGCEDCEAGEAVARRAAFAELLDRALRERNHQHQRSDERRDVGDGCLDVEELGDPRRKQQHAAEEGDEELPLQPLGAEGVVGGAA